MQAKSSCAKTLFMRNRRYCARSGLPPKKLTIDATMNVPLMFEMSNPSMRSGGESRRSAWPSVARSRPGSIAPGSFTGIRVNLRDLWVVSRRSLIISR